MTDKQKQYQQVPATALRCEATLEPIDQSKLHDDGDGVTRAPVQILARTGDAIETPYWGRIVHDLAGMTKRHTRVMVDYSHDGEPIGFCEETTVSERGLEMFAELVSTSPTARAAPPPGPARVRPRSPGPACPGSLRVRSARCRPCAGTAPARLRE